MGSISTSEFKTSHSQQTRARVSKKIHNSNNVNEDGLHKTKPMEFEVEEIHNKRLFDLDHAEIPSDFNFE